MGGGSLRGGPPSGEPAESPALPLRGGSLPESPESSCAWIQDFVKGVGWSEEQGRRAEMEDGMLVVRGFGGQRGAWLFGVYDGHGGRQTHLHANIRSEVLSRAARRREELIRREGREWVSLVKSAVDQSTRGG
ncbi:protein phosphatase, partial [Cyclospora cayetanensis]